MPNRFFNTDTALSPEGQALLHQVELERQAGLRDGITGPAPVLGCPACSSTESKQEPGAPLTVRSCKRCGALYGECYLGDSYALVKPTWHQGPTSPEAERYHDLTCLGSEGITRRHGWHHRGTKQLTQVG